MLRTHLAFVAEAREHGDEHGFLDWTPEVSHSLGDGEKVIADALMHYTLTGPAADQTEGIRRDRPHHHEQ